MSVYSDYARQPSRLVRLPHLERSFALALALASLLGCSLEESGTGSFVSAPDQAGVGEAGTGFPTTDAAPPADSALPPVLPNQDVPLPPEDPPAPIPPDVVDAGAAADVDAGDAPSTPPPTMPPPQMPPPEMPPPTKPPPQMPPPQMPPPTMPPPMMPPPVADAGAPPSKPDAQVPPPEVCPNEGSFAVRVDLDVRWEGTRIGRLPLLARGEGTLTVYAQAILRPNSSGDAALIKACGVTLPEIAGRGAYDDERYGLIVPDDVWDNATMPTWTVGLTGSCRNPGCAIETTRLEAVLGARLRDGLAAWPRRGAVLDGGFELVDHDGDDAPGLTVYARGPDDGYAYPPLGLAIWGRARELMVALGVSGTFSGTLRDCSSIGGTVADARVLTRALGCAGQVGLFGRETRCDGDFVRYFDEHLPAWSVEGGRFEARRTAVQSCADVLRAMREDGETE